MSPTLLLDVAGDDLASGSAQRVNERTGTGCRLPDNARRPGRQDKLDQRRGQAWRYRPQILFPIIVAIPRRTQCGLVTLTGEQFLVPHLRSPALLILGRRHGGLADRFPGHRKLHDLYSAL